MRATLLVVVAVLLPAGLGAQTKDSAIVRLTRRIDAIQAQLDSLRSEVATLQAPSRVSFFTPFVPAARTKTVACVSHQALPDPACTPGAVMTMNLDTICHTSTIGRRKVTEAVKKAAYAAYGVSFPQPQGTIELDHLISLELGGDNTIENLWPEFASPKPGFHEKDLVENELHKRVCTGQMILSEAQRIISTDWLTFYKENVQP